MIGGVHVNMVGRLITVRESVTQEFGAVIEFGDVWVALTAEEVDTLIFSLEAHRRLVREKRADEAAEAFSGHDDESM